MTNLGTDKASPLEGGNPALRNLARRFASVLLLLMLMQRLGGMALLLAVAASTTASASPPRRPTSADYSRYYELRLPPWVRPLRLPGHRRHIDLRYLLRFPNDPRLTSRGLPKANETWQAVAVEKHLGIRLEAIPGTDGLDFRTERAPYEFEMLTAPVPVWPLPTGVVEEEDYVRWRDTTLKRHIMKVAASRWATLVLDVEGLTPLQLEETLAQAYAILGPSRTLAYDGDGIPINDCGGALRVKAKD